MRQSSGPQGSRRLRVGFTKPYGGSERDPSMIRSEQTPASGPNPATACFCQHSARGHSPTHLLTRGLWRLRTGTGPSSSKTLLVHKAQDIHYLAFYRESMLSPGWEWTARTRTHTHTPRQ